MPHRSDLGHPGDRTGGRRAKGYLRSDYCFSFRVQYACVGGSRTGFQQSQDNTLLLFPGVMVLEACAPTQR